MEGVSLREPRPVRTAGHVPRKPHAIAPYLRTSFFFINSSGGSDDAHSNKQLVRRLCQYKHNYKRRVARQTHFGIVEGSSPTDAGDASEDAKESRKSPCSSSTSGVILDLESDSSSEIHLLIPPNAWNPYDAFPASVSPSLARKCLYDYYHRPMLQDATDAERQFELAIRRDQWIPLLLRSPVALNALVLLVELCSDSSRTLNTSIWARKQTVLILVRLQAKLQDPSEALQDEVVLTVLLLMLSSMHMNDVSAFRSHCEGLTRLMQHRQQQRTLGRSEQHVDPELSNKTYIQRQFSSIQEASFSVSDLLNRVRWYYLWPAFFDKLKHDDFTGLLANSRPSAFRLKRKTGSSAPGCPFEATCQQVFIIARLLAQQGNNLPSWAFDQMSILTNQVSQTIFDSSRGIDVDNMLYETPGSLLWVSLLAGSVALRTGSSLIPGWAWLLQGALHRLGSDITSFSDAICYLKREFAWSDVLDTNAHAFWTAATYMVAPGRPTKSREEHTAPMALSYELIFGIGTHWSKVQPQA